MITVEKLEKGTYFDDAFKISFRYDPTTVAKVATESLMYYGVGLGRAGTHIITHDIKSKKYGTTVDTLVKLNGIKNKNLINIGQVIKLP